MKKIIVTAILAAVFSFAFAQEGRKLSASEKTTFEQKLQTQSKKMSSLECDFVQEKISDLVAEKAVSKGNLFFVAPSKLRWEYTSPNISTLILNDNKAILLDKNSKPVGNAAALKQLGGIIVSMINGDGLAENKQFSTEIFELKGEQYVIVLNPIQKRLKNYYKSIEIKVDKDTYLASEISMNEKSGDKMLIHLNNKKINKNIASEKFTVK